MIPVARPVVGEEEIAAVAEVMRSGMLARGSVVAEFESRFADYCGAAHAVGVNSGTAALHAALLAAGIRPGDSVIVPAFTFFATASSVSMCGATTALCGCRPADVQHRPCFGRGSRQPGYPGGDTVSTVFGLAF